MVEVTLMRIALESALKDIKNMVLEIINIGKESIYMATKYLLEGKKEYLKALDELELKSDKLNLDIQDLCLVTMARQQPVARDMRFIASMMNISSFFERVCDLSQEISAEQIGALDEKLEEIKTNIMWMSKQVIAMIDVILDALITEKIDKLKSDLEEMDNEVDKLFLDSRKKITEYIKECNKNPEEAVKMLFIIRFLERIGDIVAKTGARIIYIEEGKHILIK